MEPIVRICSLEIANIKNVRRGKVDMPNRLPGYTPGKGELVGIYGQNGSGKTSVVHAFALLQQLICGMRMLGETDSLITVGEQEATLTLLLSIELEHEQYHVQYTVTLGKDADGARVREESLSVKANKPHARSNTIAAFSGRKPLTLPDFKPDANCKKVLGLCDRQDFMFFKMLAHQQQTSFIFNEKIYPLLAQLDGIQGTILQAVRNFAQHNLFIIDHRESSLVYVNLQPLPVPHTDEGCTQANVGKCWINLNAPSTWPKHLFHEFRQSMVYVNQVLSQIIPGLHLQEHELGLELNADNQEMMRFELLAVRAGVAIPLKYESDGIKKLISFLLYWIRVSNTPGACLIVDELDASIFEYLLGELLSVWEANAQGQLIFTAHNLHPLEMLDKSSVIFTTIDPHNRFIRLKNVKASNNLRDVYLRSIFIGGQEYELYDQTNKTEIARAIRKTMTQH